MAIIAREKGRQLELIVGGGDDALVFLVPPVPARVGAELLADWVGIAVGFTEGPEALVGARNLAQSALGAETFEGIEDLRWGEQEQIINAAFMWNVQGGGIELVNTYLDGGLPKARDELLRRSGLEDALSRFNALLDSESDALTPTADSPDTSTPDGGVNTTE